MIIMFYNNLHFVTHVTRTVKGDPVNTINCFTARGLGSNKGCDQQDMRICAPSNQITGGFNYAVYGGVHCYKDGPYAASALLKADGVLPTYPKKVCLARFIGVYKFCF
jgi:hypothetical protein